MDPLLGPLLIAVFVFIGGVNDWFADFADWLHGDGRPRHERKVQRRAQEQELRRLAMEHRHAERIAGVGGPTISEALAERIRRGPTARDQMGPVRGWWHDAATDRLEEMTRQRREREARTTAGEQLWQKLAAAARRRAEKYWDDSQTRREEKRRKRDIPDAEWWEDEPRGDDPADPDPEQGEQPDQDRTRSGPALCTRGCGRSADPGLPTCFQCRAEEYSRRWGTDSDPSTPNPEPPPHPGPAAGPSQGTRPSPVRATAERIYPTPPQTPGPVAEIGPHQDPPKGLESATNEGATMGALVPSTRRSRAAARHNQAAARVRNAAEEVAVPSGGFYTVDDTVDCARAAEAGAVGFADFLEKMRADLIEQGVRGPLPSALATAAGMIFDASGALGQAARVAERQQQDADEYAARQRQTGAGDADTYTPQIQTSRNR